MLEMLLVLSLIGALGSVILWNNCRVCRHYDHQLAKESVVRLNQLVETYALYYVQETEDAVPTWGAKEEVSRALKTPLPKTGKVILQNPELEKLLPRVNWNTGTQHFEL